MRYTQLKGKVREQVDHIQNVKDGTYDRNLDRILRMAERDGDEELIAAIKARYKKTHYDDPKDARAAKDAKEREEKHQQYSALITKIEQSTKELAKTPGTTPTIEDAIANAGLDPDKLLDLYGDEIHDAWEGLIGKPFDVYAAEISR